MLYAGDNDLAEGTSPQDVLARCLRFVEGVHRASAQTRIAFISIKASPQRVRLMPLIARANALSATAASARPDLSFVDCCGHPCLQGVAASARRPGTARALRMNCARVNCEYRLD